LRSSIRIGFLVFVDVGSETHIQIIHRLFK
jgi:hypothetical protein